MNPYRLIINNKQINNTTKPHVFTPQIVMWVCHQWANEINYAFNIRILLFSTIYPSVNIIRT